MFTVITKYTNYITYRAQVKVRVTTDRDERKFIEQHLFAYNALASRSFRLPRSNTCTTILRRPVMA